MTKQERIYGIALIVLAFLLVFCIVEYILLFMNMISDAAGTFVFEMLIFTFCGFLVIDVVMLIMVFHRPLQSRIALVALNIAFLFWFPFGTALGIYYLWKVNNQIGANSTRETVKD